MPPETSTPIFPADRSDLCVCGHAPSRHEHMEHDSRCLAVEHPADLRDRFDDGREPSGLAYCACLSFRAGENPVGGLPYRAARERGQS